MIVLFYVFFRIIDVSTMALVTVTAKVCFGMLVSLRNADGLLFCIFERNALVISVVCEAWLTLLALCHSLVRRSYYAVRKFLLILI